MVRRHSKQLAVEIVPRTQPRSWCRGSLAYKGPRGIRAELVCGAEVSYGQPKVSLARLIATIKPTPVTKVEGTVSFTRTVEIFT